MTPTADKVDALLRQAQARGLDDQAGALLDDYRHALRIPLTWNREAGRALAAEGFLTDELTVEVEKWIEVERLALQERLVRLLGKEDDECEGV